LLNFCENFRQSVFVAWWCVVFSFFQHSRSTFFWLFFFTNILKKYFSPSNGHQNSTVSLTETQQLAVVSKSKVLRFQMGMKNRPGPVLFHKHPKNKEAKKRRIRGIRGIVESITYKIVAIDQLTSKQHSHHTTSPWKHTAGRSLSLLF
jgi:hypothetical protein